MSFGRQTRGDYSLAGLQFSRREVRDLFVAWLALGAAFAIFFNRGVAGLAGASVGRLTTFLVVSLLTAGVAFLLHELAHKVVAVRFGQVAEFRADYGMLFLAVMSALLGFIFAAPGAVHHRGRITPREHGLVALAGPVTNLALAALFLPVLSLGFTLDVGALALVGRYGVVINVFLAAFNLIPYGPLDGKTVLSWSAVVWALAFLPSAALAFLALFGLGF